MILTGTQLSQMAAINAMDQNISLHGQFWLNTCLEIFQLGRCIFAYYMNVPTIGPFAQKVVSNVPVKLGE